MSLTLPVPLSASDIQSGFSLSGRCIYWDGGNYICKKITPAMTAMSGLISKAPVMAASIDKSCYFMEL